MGIYRYAVLDPTTGNEEVFAGWNVVGIEVTEPALARRCSTNIDPQHSGGGDEAAIEAALHAALPPTNTVLATIRPDLDSIGAMAVFELRAAGRLGPAAIPRVRQIAVADSFRHGPWPGPAMERRETTALHGLARIVADATVPLPERVRRVAAWLQRGRCEGLARSIEAARRDWHAAVDGAEVTIMPSGRVACVLSDAPTAIGVGYRYAPIVVAENPSYRMEGGRAHRKVTVAQYEAGWVDWSGLRADLNRADPGWGGTETILGSPQGRDSVLSAEEVARLVHGHLLGASAADPHREPLRRSATDPTPGRSRRRP